MTTVLHWQEVMSQVNVFNAVIPRGLGPHSPAGSAAAPERAQCEWLNISEEYQSGCCALLTREVTP